MRAWGQAALDNVNLGPLFAGGDLRGTLDSLLPNRPNVNTGLGWTTQGSLGVSVGATDNPGGLNNQHQWSFTSLISPSYALSGASGRLTARFLYSPQVVLYTGSNQSRISNNFNGQATATLVPEHLFVDVRAFVMDQGGYGQTGLTPLSVGQTSTTSAFQSNGSSTETVGMSVNPYYVERFGGWGAVTVGDALSHNFLGNQYNGARTTQVSGLPGYNGTGSLTTNREYIQFTTGENFNRFNYTANASTSQYLGGGSTYGGDNYDINNGFSYAVSHAITLLASVGYQTLSYGGSTLFKQNYINWNVGTRLTPNADSTLTLTYGDSQGGATWQFSGRYSPTPRLTFYGSYHTSVSTYLQQQQDLLQNTVVGPNGILVDRTTGAPVSAVNPFGIQNSPSRVYQLQLGAGYVINRDSFSAAFSRYTNTTLTPSSSAVGTVVPSGTPGVGTTGTLTWQHDINPVTSLTNTVGYGVVENGAFVGNTTGSQRTFAASTTLGRTFTQTLTGTLSYSYYERSGATSTTLQGAGNATQNLFLVGLRKTF